MELGSDSASFLPTSQDHAAHSSSSNGGPMDSSFQGLNSPSCNGELPAGILSERDEAVSKEEEVVHAARWILDENTTSASNEPERVPATHNVPEIITASHNVPERMLPAPRRRTFFMIRMPRAADSELRSKIKLAELQLEDASKTRDVVRAALQLRRASKLGLLDKLKVVREKERACKDAFQKKRLEIDPLQNALNKFKSADIKFKEEIFSEEDLDNKISRLQHRIQHESIPLKEEKQLIREIKQLESQRSHVCANDAKQAHLLESYGPKEDIQDQLDVLYRELDALRANQNQARLECEPVEKDLEELNVKIDELVDQLEGAKRSQGAALATCKELKKFLGEQNAEFYKNREDVRKARELAFSKNLDDLAVLCHEQVESILRCWNSDLGFRERYIRNNEQSTLRRLETLDGRALGPDEEPVLLMSDTDLATETLPKTNEDGSRMGLQKDVIKEASVSAGPGNRVKKLQADEVKLKADKIVQGASDSRSQKEEVTDSKKFEEKLTENLISTRPSSSVATSAVPVEDDAAKAVQAAELKEKRRQQEIAKAKEAAERKRRQAERAQAKEQLRAQRDAERKEKEREKKARKKAAVGSGDLKHAEVPEIEERETELVTEDLPKESVKGSSSQGRGPWVNQPKTRRQTVSGPYSKKKVWPVPSMWLWVSFVIIVIGLALTFMAKL
eukprot:c1333_g1_i1 orf=151-2187(+)